MPINDGDDTQQDPTEGTPEEDTADTHGDVGQRVARIVLRSNRAARREQQLKRDQQQQQQLHCTNSGYHARTRHVKRLLVAAGPRRR